MSTFKNLLGVEYTIIPSAELTALRARLAEVERERDELKAKCERLEFEANPVHSCGPTCQRPACVMRRERDDARADAVKAHTMACAARSDADRWSAVADGLADAMGSQLHWWQGMPSGVDLGADELNESPKDTAAHIAGLAVREIRTALSAYEASKKGTP